MLRYVDSAGNNGHNILSTEMVFNRFIIGDEKACDTVRVQVNILCSMVGITERSFFSPLFPTPLSHLPSSLRSCSTFDAYQFRELDSWQTAPAFQEQNLEYKVETALWQRVSSFKVMLYYPPTQEFLGELVYRWWKNWPWSRGYLRSWGRPFRWCYIGRFATTVFSATQRCNVGSTLQLLECRNNVATLYCTKNRRRKSSRVASPLVAVSVVEKLKQESMYWLSAGTKKSSQYREVAVVEMRPLVEVRLCAPSTRENHFPRGWWLISSHAKVGHRCRERRGDFHELSRFSVFALV